ncbi:hypothetical protein C8J56DRAFT_1156767 [Mycena floridula]|nr:hypothetical protein C8J56DRAFT_1156767 [Mycena floridula]
MQSALCRRHATNEHVRKQQQICTIYHDALSNNNLSIHNRASGSQMMTMANDSTFDVIHGNALSNNTMTVGANYHYDGPSVGMPVHHPSFSGLVAAQWGPPSTAFIPSVSILFHQPQLSRLAERGPTSNAAVLSTSKVHHPSSSVPTAAAGQVAASNNSFGFIQGDALSHNTTTIHNYYASGILAPTHHLRGDVPTKTSNSCGSDSEIKLFSDPVAGPTTPRLSSNPVATRPKDYRRRRSQRHTSRIIVRAAESNPVFVLHGMIVVVTS